ncbi:WXG100 family type VII secretion target [Bacteroides heparinolyticus]|uniref:WXG100 family type VII secretion target n=1 Tax=Prevotella heparinolytica TaxID=28113 RepID=UPI0035A01583
MANQIRITPEAMHDRANEFRGAQADFDQIVEKMRGLITTLQGEWEGQASNRFASQFEALQPSFTKMSELIFDIAKQCDDVADATQALDEEIASKFL